MDSTIRNLDEKAYRELRAHCALTGKTMGQAVSEAIRAYITRVQRGPRRGSLIDLQPEPYPPGNESLSETVDELVYAAAPATPSPTPPRRKRAR